jgi:hypothetical protein
MLWFFSLYFFKEKSKLFDFLEVGEILGFSDVGSTAPIQRSNPTLPRASWALAS